MNEHEGAEPRVREDGVHGTAEAIVARRRSCICILMAAVGRRASSRSFLGGVKRLKTPEESLMVVVNGNSRGMRTVLPAAGAERLPGLQIEALYGAVCVCACILHLVLMCMRVHIPSICVCMCVYYNYMEMRCYRL